MRVMGIRVFFDRFDKSDGGFKKDLDKGILTTCNLVKVGRVLRDDRFCYGRSVVFDVVLKLNVEIDL